MAKYTNKPPGLLAKLLVSPHEDKDSPYLSPPLNEYTRTRLNLPKTINDDFICSRQ